MKTETEDKTTFATVLAMADKAQSVISGKVEQVAQALLALASGMSTPDQFEAGCQSAETARKARMTEIAADKGLSKKDRKAFVKLPSAWSNAKSILLRGWEDHGLIPNDFETFSQYKDAKDGAVKATKVKVTKGESAGADEGADAITERMEKGSITEVLFGDLMTRVAALPSETQEIIAAELDSIVSQFEGNQGDAEVLENAQVASVAH